MWQVLADGLDYVVFFDGDGQHRVEDLQVIIDTYEAEHPDLIVASRFHGVDRVPWTLRSFGTRSFSTLTTLLAGTPVTDVTNGMKLISSRFIPVALKLPAQDLHAKLIVGLSRAGARIREVKVTVLPRATGKSMYGFYRAVLYPAKTFLCLLCELLFYRRLRAEAAPRAQAASDNPKESR